MKKPEKKKPIHEKNLWDRSSNYITTGFNEGLDDSDKYHEWDKKQNYVRKDGLSVRIKEMVEVYGVNIGWSVVCAYF